MAEYHVGCGAFGIYAGTLNAKQDQWRTKSEVTDEAISATIQWLKSEMDMKGETERYDEYFFSDGTIMNVNITLMQDGAQTDA